MHFGGLGKRRPLVTCGRECIGVPSPQIRRTRQAETELHTIHCFRLPFISERISEGLLVELTARGTAASEDQVRSCGTKSMFLPQARRSNLRP